MRLPDESESAYFAFRSCLESGPVRGIAAAYRSVKLLGYFNNWAARYEWQQRAAEWDAHIESLATTANVAELQAARKQTVEQTVEQAAGLQAIIAGEMETLREEIAKARRIGGPPVDHSAELATLAAALESAARARLIALGGGETE